MAGQQFAKVRRRVEKARDRRAGVTGPKMRAALGLQATFDQELVARKHFYTNAFSETPVRSHRPLLSVQLRLLASVEFLPTVILTLTLASSAERHAHGSSDTFSVWAANFFHASLHSSRPTRYSIDPWSRSSPFRDAHWALRTCG